MTQLVADLKSGEQGRYLRRLLQLQRKKPAKPNWEVAQALEALTASDNPSARHLSTRALANWATPESAEALLKLLDDKSPIVRGPAMTALGNLNTRKPFH
jgi:HEAT repeat protein